MNREPYRYYAVGDKFKLNGKTFITVRKEDEMKRNPERIEELRKANFNRFGGDIPRCCEGCDLNYQTDNQSYMKCERICCSRFDRKDQNFVWFKIIDNE